MKPFRKLARRNACEAAESIILSFFLIAHSYEKWPVAFAFYAGVSNALNPVQLQLVVAGRLNSLYRSSHVTGVRPRFFPGIRVAYACLAVVQPSVRRAHHWSQADLNEAWRQT